MQFYFFYIGYKYYFISIQCKTSSQPPRKEPSNNNKGKGKVTVNNVANVRPFRSSSGHGIRINEKTGDITYNVSVINYGLCWFAIYKFWQ